MVYLRFPSCVKEHITALDIQPKVLGGDIFVAYETLRPHMKEGTLPKELSTHINFENIVFSPDFDNLQRVGS